MIAPVKSRLWGDGENPGGVGSSNHSMRGSMSERVVPAGAGACHCEQQVVMGSAPQSSNGMLGIVAAGRGWQRRPHG